MDPRATESRARSRARRDYIAALGRYIWERQKTAQDRIDLSLVERVSPVPTADDMQAVAAWLKTQVAVERQKAGMYGLHPKRRIA